MGAKYFLLLILIVILILLINNKNEYFTNLGNFYVSNMYIINLDRDYDKMDLLKKELDKNNYKYTRFPAIDGQTLSPNDYRLEKYFGNYKVSYSMGQKCCTLSHLAIWEKILENNTNYNIIIEDDVIIPSHLYKKLDIYLQQLPDDWDFLFLGGNRIIGSEYSKNIIIPTNRRVNGNYGTFAYLINSKNLNEIVNDSMNIVDHIDVHIQRKLGKKYNIYFCNPQLIKHNYDSVSNIRNKNRSNEADRNNKITII